MNDQDFLAEIQKEFLEESTFLLEECEQSFLDLETSKQKEDELAKIFRLAHSLKGTGTAVGFSHLASFAHIVEDYLSILRVYPEWVTPESVSLLLKAGDAFKERIESLKAEDNSEWDVSELGNAIKKQTEDLNRKMGETPEEASKPKLSVPKNVENLGELAAQETKESLKAKPSKKVPKGAKSGSVKIDIDRIDSVMDLVGELVVIKSQFVQGDFSSSVNSQYKSMVGILDRTVRELHDRTLSMRMTSLKPLFIKLQRIVRDLSINLKKPIDLDLRGEETEIDRTMIELLNDPLVHIVRNAIDHGVETTEDRISNGKSKTAKVSIQAFHSGGRVIIEVHDDGGGIDRAKVLSKAESKGLLVPGKSKSDYSDSEAFDFIFSPGFSTAAAVTNISGRGVGLDVVKTNIEKMRGTISVDSALGKGSVFKISLPLTTAITDGMLVSVGGLRYILPLYSIRELVQIDSKDINRTSQNEKAITVRGTLLPMVDTRTFLNSKIHNAIRNSDENKEDLDIHEKGNGMTGSRQTVVTIELGETLYAFKVDGVFGQNQFVIKSLGASFKKIQSIAGAAILGDGRVALVVDIEGLIKEYKAAMRAGRKSPESLNSREARVG